MGDLLDVIARKDRELQSLREQLAEKDNRLANAVEVLSASYNVLSQHDLLAEHQALGDAILAVLL